TASITNYQSALQSVTYENTSNEPTTIIRTIGYSVNDGVDNSPVSNTQNEIEIEVLPGEIVVYNAVSPNGDGKHDFFEITNITGFPNNQVNIFNRWGDMVYAATGYDNGNKSFRGVSNLGGKNELPEGTYYYSINLNDGSNTLSGFLVLNR
ncbi:MAG: gliding motility-associated C-terminal domain-containing protein, partial [Bacteroidetes bacterium]|nr:gliding motility-associated C-terminal domain-containing protein [Bacteroidota bacterium]